MGGRPWSRRAEWGGYRSPQLGFFLWLTRSPFGGQHATPDSLPDPLHVSDVSVAGSRVFGSLKTRSQFRPQEGGLGRHAPAMPCKARNSVRTPPAFVG
jgi:hypothetical protein